MMKMYIGRLFLAAASAAMASAAAAEAVPAPAYRAVTRPSADHTIAFPRAGIVRFVHFTEGEPVRSGNVIMELDAVSVSLRIARIQKEIEAGTAGPAAEEKIDELLEERDLCLLRSPDDGRVEMLALGEGEAAVPFQTAARVVCISPLAAEAMIPLEDFPRFAEGTAVTAEFPDGEKAEGRIIFRSSAAGPDGKTLRITARIPNPENRPAGEQIFLHRVETRRDE